MHFKKFTIKTLYWQPDKYLNLVLITMRRLNRNTITNKSAEQQRTEVQSPKPAHNADTLTSLSGRASLQLQLFPPKRCMALVRLTVSDLFALLIMFSIMAIHYTKHNRKHSISMHVCVCMRVYIKHANIRRSVKATTTETATAMWTLTLRVRVQSPNAVSEARVQSPIPMQCSGFLLAETSMLC